jgi:hypothetical protein
MSISLSNAALPKNDPDLLPVAPIIWDLSSRQTMLQARASRHLLLLQDLQVVQINVPDGKI